MRTTKELQEMYTRIKKSVEHLPADEAIRDLEERIFYEQMADFMDFEFVRICESIIKELKDNRC